MAGVTRSNGAALDRLNDLWRAAGGADDALDRVSITGEDPVLPSTFRVGTAAAATIAAAGLAASEIWRLRTGRKQTVSLEMLAAAIAFRSERYLTVDGEPYRNLWDPIAGYYQTGDGRWLQLHTNFPHHRDGVLELLHCANSREGVERALQDWSGQEIEDALASAGLCAGMLRSPAEWQAHPQGQAVARLPLFEIERVGDAPAEGFGPGDRPLSGVRVLDLTRVIAGPVCGRNLAEHGAEVMRIAGPHLPYMPPLVVDSGRGKRSAFVDLRRPEGRDRLASLVRESDVFVQGYRPGAIAGRGFSPEVLADLRPGIVCVSLCAYGREGPWRDRRGFDSLVQTVSGIAWEGGQAAGVDGPKPLPAQALDHATGYLAAFGAMMALARRAEEGGSWHVRVSLAQTGHWIDGLGRVDGLDHPEPDEQTIASYMQTTESPFGLTRHVAPVVRLSETPPYWAIPAVPLGTHTPEWPARRAA